MRHSCFLFSTLRRFIYLAFNFVPIETAATHNRAHTNTNTRTHTISKITQFPSLIECDAVWFDCILHMNTYYSGAWYFFFRTRTYTNTFTKCVRALCRFGQKQSERERGGEERVNTKMKLQANWIHKANIYTYYQMASSLCEGERKLTHFSLLFNPTHEPL